MSSVHWATIRDVVLNEGYTLTELIMIIPNIKRAITINTRVVSILFFCMKEDRKNTEETQYK